MIILGLLIFGMGVFFLLIAISLSDWLRQRFDFTKQCLKENQGEIMSKLSELGATLTALETKLESVDAAVKALVAAANNSDVTLDDATQAALDKLSAEVDTLTTDSTTPPAAPTA